MEAKNQNFFDKESIMRAMQTPEGQRLMALLKSQDSASLQKAAQAAAQGRTAEAQALLEPVLRSKEAAQFQEKMKGR